jgi:hypothetical protein
LEAEGADGAGELNPFADVREVDAIFGGLETNELEERGQIGWFEHDALEVDVAAEVDGQPFLGVAVCGPTGEREAVDYIS